MTVRTVGLRAIIIELPSYTSNNYNKFLEDSRGVEIITEQFDCDISGVTSYVFVVCDSTTQKTGEVLNKGFKNYGEVQSKYFVTDNHMNLGELNNFFEENNERELLNIQYKFVRGQHRILVTYRDYESSRPSNINTDPLT